MQRLASGALAVVLGGCCTQVGCANGVEFDLAHDLEFGVAYEVEACVDGACQSAEITVNDPLHEAVDGDDGVAILVDHDQVLLDLPNEDYSGLHELHVSVREAESGAVLTDHDETVEFVKTEPNGAMCGPTCWYAKVSTPAVAPEP